MSILLEAVVPIALIVMVGFIVGRSLTLDHATLSQLILYVLFPALIVDGLYRTEVSFSSAFGLVFGFALVSLILFILVFSVNRFLRLPLDTFKSLVACSLLGNNGNLGLPLTTFVLGEQGLTHSLIHVMASSILMFGIIPPFLSGKSWRFGLNLTIKSPLIWSMILGFVVHISGLKLPAGLQLSIRQLGAACIPFALLLLGIQLCKTSFKVGKYEIMVTAIALLISPFVAWSVGLALHLSPLDFKVLILQSSMPVAVNTVVLITAFGGDISLASRSVVFSTLASFLTIPFILDRLIS